ncbi:MAG: CHAT domain-containing protein [Anaerolineae bacterium]|nr:CHAT domain-containing protein [Anaerolineae bacterium]
MIPWIATDNQVADGKRLFAALFADPELRRAWDIACGQSSQRRIRLWLDVDAPELHALPWELLHDGLTFLAADTATPFSRYLPSDAPWGGLVTERPIRILVVISSPADLDQYKLTPIDVAAERTLLVEALGDLAPTHFRLEFLEAPVTPERLERALASGPHVLHFVGHGAFSGRQRQVVLYLQDRDDNVQLVTDIQLTNMLRRQKPLPSLIFLAACQSAERSVVDAFAGLAPKLVQAGVPAVVAMQDKVAMATTRMLTPVFYEELAQHGEVDRALNAARSLLLTGQSPDTATPVLLMRLKEGKLWEPLWVTTNPYRGLAAFTEADTAFFFGRESLITELSDKVRRQRFIAVVGPSGSGKSSVVQAGLLPRLPKDWQVIKLRPGNNPYASADLSGFRKPDRSEKRQVIFIDQFEELFALCSPDVQTRFLNDLQVIIDSPACITVILTLRADFFGYLQNSPLGKHLEYALVNVLPMEPADLCAAITEPAQAVGLHLEAGLEKIIVDDAQQAKHTLPLLQFALTELWEHQTQGTLTYDAYTASGRVAGAIGLWAEDTYNGLTTEEQQLARRVFTRLVHYGEVDAVDTRQRRALPELLTQPDEHEALRRLLLHLADRRLLTTDEVQGVESVEIIHDALLKEWPRLKQWLAEQREFYLWRQRLEDQLRLWESKAHDDGALLRGALLVEAEQWMQKQPEELNPDECAYIKKSVTCRKQEHATRERLRRRIVAGLVIGLGLMTVLAILFLNQRNVAKDALTAAEIRRLEAITSRLAAESLNLPDWQYDLALLLGVEAYTREDTVQTRGSLLATLESHPRLLAFLRGHNSVVTSVAYSPNAKMIASGAWNCRILLHSTSTITTSRTLWQPRDDQDHCSVYSLAFSPDGKILATSSRAMVVLWDVEQGITTTYLLGYNDWIPKVIFSPDGSQLASASADGSIFLWDMQNLQTPTVMRGNKGAVWDIAFSPDGKILAAANEEQTVTLWDLKVISMPVSLPLVGHSGVVQSVMFTANVPDFPGDLTLVSGGADKTVRVWEVSTSQGYLSATLATTLTGHNSSIQTIAISPDGTTLASGSTDGSIIWWDMASWRQLDVLTGHSGSINDTVFSPDGKQLASSNRGIQWCRPESDGVTRVWGCGDSTVILWDLETEQSLGTPLDSQSAVRDVAFSADGTKLVTSNVDSVTHLWEITTAQVPEITATLELTMTEPTYEVSAMALNPAGTILAVGSTDKTIHLWHLVSGYVLSATPGITLTGHQATVKSLAFSADGTRLASGSEDETIILWDIDSSPPVSKTILYGHQGSVESVVFNSKGTLLASGGEDRAVILWDLQETSPSGTPLGGKASVHAGYVRSVTFSPDDKLLASGSADQTVILWDVADFPSRIPTVSARFAAHNDEVYSVAFSPDGEMLASGSADKTIILWDVATGKMLGNPLTGHKAAVRGVAFYPHAKDLVLISGSLDQTIIFWDVNPASWSTRACGIANRNLTHAEWAQYLGDEPYRATCPNLPIPEETQP